MNVLYNRFASLVWLIMIQLRVKIIANRTLNHKCIVYHSHLRCYQNLMSFATNNAITNLLPFKNSYRYS